MEAAGSLVRVHNEWDPLEEVIVGSARGARVPSPDPGLWAIDYPGCATPDDIPSGPYPSRVVEEAQEDLDHLAQMLTQAGVTVRRPDDVDHSHAYSTPDWTADGEYAYCPRDALLPVGSTIIEAPMTLRTRYFETRVYRSLLHEYFTSGARWVAAPKPQLPDGTWQVTAAGTVVLREVEPIFDAANVIRIGRDILYQVSCSGNKFGMRWLQRELGDDYRVHPVEGVYPGTHLDTTIAVVRPGLVVLCPDRIREDQIPEIFKGWDVLWCPPMVDTGWEGPTPRASIWQGMNFIMLNPNCAVVGDAQKPLIDELAKRGVDVLPVPMRQARTLSGGVHCVTVDVRRAGTLQDYR